jgi:hypothetical protein
MAGQGRALTPLLLHPKIDGVARDAHPPSGGLLLYRSPQTLIDCLIGFLINEQPNSDLLLGFIFVSLPFEFFQKRGPHKVGDANKFMPRCALNFEEHGVRYAGLDRSAVGSRKHFTALALSKGVGLRHPPRRPKDVCVVQKMKLCQQHSCDGGHIFRKPSGPQKQSGLHTGLLPHP